jgi:hypothetical protein
MKNIVFISQCLIQFFVGLTAVVSGAMLIVVPTGSLLQMPPDMLKATPFDDFLLPGVMLFLVIGVGHVAGGVLTMRRHRFAGYSGAALGFGLMIWIFVQVNMIGGGHILQYSYFMLGVIEAALSFVIQDLLSAAGGRY